MTARTLVLAGFALSIALVLAPFGAADALTVHEEPVVPFENASGEDHYLYGDVYFSTNGEYVVGPDAEAGVYQETNGVPGLQRYPTCADGSPWWECPEAEHTPADRWVCSTRAPGSVDDCVGALV